MLPALPPLTARHHPQTLKEASGPAALLMALSALGWSDDGLGTQQMALWEDARDVKGGGETDATGLAHAAMRRGLHCTVWTNEGAPASGTHRDALAAGLRVRHASSVALALAEALEAGHPVLARVHAAALPSSTGGPRWVAILGRVGDDAMVHDPQAMKGPSRVPMATLLAGIERVTPRALLELAHGKDATGT